MSETASSNATLKPKRKQGGKGRPIQKGQVLNPHGRQVGSRNRLQEQYWQVASKLFNEGGEAALRTMMETEPSKFSFLIGGHMSKQVEVSEATIYEKLSDAELFSEISSTLQAIKLLPTNETIQ